MNTVVDFKTRKPIVQEKEAGDIITLQMKLIQWRHKKNENETNRHIAITEKEADSLISFIADKMLDDA